MVRAFWASACFVLTLTLVLGCGGSADKGGVIAPKADPNDPNASKIKPVGVGGGGGGKAAQGAQ
jgi:hypothetical protein